MGKIQEQEDLYWRSTVSRKSRDVNFYLERMRIAGIELDCVKVYSTAGDIHPPYPFQFQAIAKLRIGDDDPLEGIGGSILEAIRNLCNVIIKEEYLIK